VINELGDLQDLDDADLRRYTETQVNLTTLKLQKSHLPNTQPTRSHNGLPDYAIVHDSLLTLYHGIKLHNRNFGSCHWAGKDHIVPTLTKVCLDDGIIMDNMGKY